MLNKCKKNINNQAQFTLQCVTTNFTVNSWRKVMVKGSVKCFILFFKLVIQKEERKSLQFSLVSIQTSAQ